MTRAKKQPLYDQLVELLKEKIENEYEANMMLPSERELSDVYGLSRTTVRLALQELEKIGYIYRQHGKGTFVSDLKESSFNLQSMYSFTEQMKSLGRHPETRVLDFETIEANKFLATKFNVKLGTKLIKMKRLRSADGEPLMLERTYLPLNKFLSLTKEDLDQKALYDIFREDYNEIVKVAEEELFANIARPKDAPFLDIREGAPVLTLMRKTYNQANEIIEFTYSVARADHFRYKIVHHNGN
ncbi:GntR family transcriptional regulator [Enterococcus sp. MJM12]|uniref:GntR family transcriptional regulator n=1 Tax=Candidatus Enterococcus myersii TaxID=2815322 RepID=A0ABS3H441_9ENTE|nr:MULTISPECIES: GntR family transcriptional regulator [Enterococcus]MBO0448221.1 GntR family transcriptional regulator [Enterococcus sp. MJM12]MCD1024163.1 GntR family transcriptional regulator [Enterococcus sp. SMC-9]MDT2739403.1 GntR family transcriptional regulator [Enterococcus canintestini]